MEFVKVNEQFDGKKLAVGILIPVIGGSITGWLANRNTQEQYEKLKKPAISPPGVVFPIVWTSLYTLMGIADYRAKMNVTKENRNEILVPYDIQLGLNFLWSFLFFKWELRGTALIEMTILLGAIALTTYEFNKVDKIAGMLMIPYIGWVVFALCLNFSLWKKNK